MAPRPQRIVFGNTNPRFHPESKVLRFCSFLRFDTELRVWESRQSMPHNCNARDYEAIVFNGKIYVAGGLVSNAVYSHRLCCYDPSTDTWAEKSQINFEMSGLVMFTWKETIYAACTDAVLRKHDLENDTWHAVSHKIS